MNNINWGIIVAIISAAVAAMGLIFQRIDIRKQSKYQRDTFELQNEINNINILISLASDIIGVIQMQEQMLQQLREDSMILKRKKFELKKKNSPTFESSYKPEYSEVSLLKDEISYYEARNEEKIDATRMLSKELTSKGKAIQIHMFTNESFKEISSIFKEIKTVLSDMETSIITIMSFEEEGQLTKVVDTAKWSEDYDNRIKNNISKFQTCFTDLKKESAGKLDKLKNN